MSLRFHSVRIINHPSALCPAEGDPAVGRDRVLCRLHPHLRHHSEYRVPVSQGESLNCFFSLLHFFYFFCQDSDQAFLSPHQLVFPALCHHRAVRSGGDGGVCDPLPDPPAEEASPLVVDLPSGPQDQRVPPVWTQRSACLLYIRRNVCRSVWNLHVDTDLRPW